MIDVALVCPVIVVVRLLAYVRVPRINSLGKTVSPESPVTTLPDCVIVPVEYIIEFAPSYAVIRSLPTSSPKVRSPSSFKIIKSSSINMKVIESSG